MVARPNPLYAACVSRAAALVGGFDQLGAQLGVKPARLRKWAEGVGEPPQAVFLRIVDLLLDDGIGQSLVSASVPSRKPQPPKSK
jgi:hypothetical protein